MHLYNKVQKGSTLPTFLRSKSETETVFYASVLPYLDFLFHNVNHQLGKN